MKYLLAFILIAFAAKLSIAESSVHVCEPDSIRDSVLCAPASAAQAVKNGETGMWKMYTAAPSQKTDSIQIQLNKDNEVKEKLKRRKKIFAVMLAFPLPCGIFGAHRIYLGTKPYVPLVYMASLGGAAGIVPFIDFIVLLLEKDISKYENNSSIIMWAK